jgi:NitT/TauT family transport system substrate-binding protein
MAKVKTSGKIAMIVMLLVVIFCGKIFWWDKRPVSDKDVIKIGVVTWPGYLGGQVINDGFLPNKESRMYKDYGLLVEFVKIDNFEASRKAFESDEINLLWCTADALSTELGAKGTLLTYSPKFIFQADWSRGGDAIVVRQGINKVSDLKGKKIAVAQGTPSHTFLIDILRTNNLNISDVTVNYVPSAIDAADMFKNNAVDASVVWSPDDQICTSKVIGSKILASTSTATNIIADGFICKESYMKANTKKLEKLYEAWMVGNAELNADKDGIRVKGAKILAKEFQQSEEDALASMKTVRYTTHGDNLNFFGLGDSKSVTGDNLYTKMANIYSTLKIVENPVSWRDASNISIVQSFKLTGDIHNAEKSFEFAKITKEIEGKEAFSNKAVTINFQTGKYELTDDDKFTINKEFADILKTYQAARIRIEGNTDNTGSKQTNVDLSYKRANSVKKYLMEQYGVNENRIIVVGNGPKYAIKDGIVGENDQYRRTDFQLIQ